MPPRLLTAAIILAWLATTSMLIYRELAPRFQAGEPPPFTIPLTAEVGSETVNWHVLHKDEKLGSGQTKISMKPGRTFELSAQFTLQKLKILMDWENIRITGVYRVTEDGRLLSAEGKVKIARPLQVEIAYESEIRERMLHPKFSVRFLEQVVSPALKPIPVGESGSVLNPMHLVHRISGLRAGQSWAIPLMDPLRAAPTAIGEDLPFKLPVVNQVYATVTTADLSWHGQTVPCFKIDYAKPHERPLAATWVRRRDDAVLQQWASFEGMEYTLQRTPEQ